jgi:hypothetical protein
VGEQAKSQREKKIKAGVFLSSVYFYCYYNYAEKRERNYCTNAIAPFRG